MDVSPSQLLDQAKDRFALEDYYGCVHLLEELVGSGRAYADAHHLLALAQTHGIPKSRVSELIDLVGLHEVAGKRAGQFSLGMGQRLGIAAARQRTSIAWRTTFNTPPRLMPRDCSSSMKWTGTPTVTFACSLMRRKSTWIGRSLTGWN